MLFGLKADPEKIAMSLHNTSRLSPSSPAVSAGAGAMGVHDMSPRGGSGQLSVR